MKKGILITITLLFMAYGNAQTGIGTTSPDASAKLDISSTTNKDIYIYSEFNSTSINHIIIGTSGYNSLDIRNKAITLLNKYNEWFNIKP